MIDYIIKSPEEYEVIISDRTSPEFLQTAQAVSDHLRGLPLTAEQNDKLIELIVKNMVEAERGAFKKGIEIGVKIGREEQS